MKTDNILVLAALSVASLTHAQTTAGSTAPTTTSASPASGVSASGSYKTSTVYYAPVTVIVPSACIARTAFGYISMETVSSNFEQAAAMTPWTTASFEATPTDAPRTEDYNTSPYLQVAIFLTEQPYPMAPNGEEQAWTRACYDPRHTPCPSESPIGGPSALSCMPTFPGAQVTFPSAPQVTASGSQMMTPSRLVAMVGAGLASLALIF